MSKKTRQEEFEKAIEGFKPHCIKCGYTLLHDEKICPKCGSPIQLSPEEIWRQQMEYICDNNPFTKIGNSTSSVGNGLENSGSNLNKTGNTLIGGITIPIIIIVILILLALF